MIAVHERPASSPRRVNRVLMTVDAVGGVWRFGLDLGAGLRRRGMETTLVVMGPPPDAHQRREAARAGLALVDAPYRLEWMDDAERDVERSGEWLLTLASALQPDVVHLNGYAHGALPWPVPVVVVAHSCVRSWWRAVKQTAAPSRYDRYSAAVARGLVAADAVVAPTAAMRSMLHDEYRCISTGQIIPNGCRAAGSAVRLAQKQPLVLAAGRLWDEAKSIDTLCQAAGGLDWPICVAGQSSGPDGEARTLPNVQVLGPLSSRELGAWYRRAAIYCLPARYEPFGLSILEAACAGCALVLGDIPSLRETWSGAAIFVKPGDAGALESALRSLMADAAFRTRFARSALSRAASFTLDRTTDAYVQLYESLTA